MLCTLMPELNGTLVPDYEHSSLVTMLRVVTPGGDAPRPVIETRSVHCQRSNAEHWNEIRTQDFRSLRDFGSFFVKAPHPGVRRPRASGATHFRSALHLTLRAYQNRRGYSIFGWLCPAPPGTCPEQNRRIRGLGGRAQPGRGRAISLKSGLDCRP